MNSALSRGAKPKGLQQKSLKLNQKTLPQNQQDADLERAFRCSIFQAETISL